MTSTAALDNGLGRVENSVREYLSLSTQVQLRGSRRDSVKSAIEHAM
jgi:hypothetical protein